MLRTSHKLRLRVIAVVCFTLIGAFEPQASYAEEDERVTVQLEVPSNRPGCNDLKYLKYELKRSLAVREDEEAPRGTVHVRITEPEADAFTLFLKVTRQGAPAVEHSESYPAPTECSKVVTFAANDAASLLLTSSSPQKPRPPPPPPPPQPPQPPPPPPQPPQPLRGVDIGFVAYGNIIPNTTGPGGRLTLEVPLKPRVYVRSSLNVLFPLMWSTGAVKDTISEHRATASWMLIAAFDTCYKLHFLGACWRLNVGTAQTAGVTPVAPKADSVSVVSTGPHVTVELPQLGRGEHGRFQFTVEGGSYFNIVAHDVIATSYDAAGKQTIVRVAPPAWISFSLGVGFKHTF